MARYDIMTMSAGRMVIDVQSDTVDFLNTRIVIPLIPIERSPKPIPRLNPIIDFDSAPYVLATHQMSAVTLDELKKRVGSAKRYADDITSAIDFAFFGF